MEVLERRIRVADEAWVGLALLHREQPDRRSFSAREILERTRRESRDPLRPGVQAHIYLHNVANLEPNSARYRMFVRIDGDTYRLFRPGDPAHPARKGKTAPERSELPETYQFLLDWYEREYCVQADDTLRDDDPVLKLWGLGKEIWSGTTADEYVASLRAGWEEEQVKPQSVAPVGIWDRMVKNQGLAFRTTTGLTFTYKVEGNGVWFFRDGRRINQMLTRAELEEGLRRVPLTGPSDLKDLRDSSYLYGLLSDPRIVGSARHGG